VEVQKIINKVQDNVLEMSCFINDNTEKLTSQNEIFMTTFQGIHDMNELPDS